MAAETSAVPLVGVVMGSKSDWETMRHASELLTELGILMSQRLSRLIGPRSIVSVWTKRPERGLEVLIAGAGGAAHLPGMLAAISLLPVAGCAGRKQDAARGRFMLSIVQMPRGVPVGTLAIGGSGAANAALLAAAILGPEVTGDTRGPRPLPPGTNRRRWENRRHDDVPACQSVPPTNRDGLFHRRR